MNKKIVLTGGGTAGHVNPNIALLPTLQEIGYAPYYIGSHNGIEKHLIGEYNIPYFSIATGKLRRYLDRKNFSDIFRVIRGINEAKSLLKKISPDIIFSKGGYVSVPVVIAANRLHIPVIIHESDSTPGLANRISFTFSTKICASFPETITLLPEEKAVLTGTPIREEITHGSRKNGLSYCGFTENKPVLTIMGGSIGSAYINELIRNSLDKFLKHYNIIHLCGKGNLDSSLSKIEGYAQFEYVSKNLGDILAATDLIISRAGANALFEILALKKPNILIPLPANQSRGDQILNAKSFEESGYSQVINQEDLDYTYLVKVIEYVLDNKSKYISKMEKSKQANSIERITGLIETVVSQSKA